VRDRARSLSLAEGGEAVRSLLDTPYGPVRVKVVPGELTDTWWARLEEVPGPLSDGGPTVATGATCELAMSVLRVAIERFESSTLDGDAKTPATAYQDLDGKWVVDVPTEGVIAIGPTLDRALAIAARGAVLDVRFRNERRKSA
jgi:predicted RNase H-like HicB family nuclease